VDIFEKINVSNVYPLPKRVCYFLSLYPVGHLGALPEIVFEIFPFWQIMEIFLGATFCGVTTIAGASTSCDRLTFTVGAENSKFRALKWSQPSFSPTTVVATCGAPEALMTETLALIGAFENP
jgi:hypothetical protein